MPWTKSTGTTKGTNIGPRLGYYLLISAILIASSCDAGTSSKSTKSDNNGSVDVSTNSRTPADTSPARQSIYLDPLSLEIGHTYSVSRRTPLMPFHDPVDPMSAIALIKYIPKDGGFGIVDIREKRSNPWYEVIAFDQNAVEIGMGWINSTALIGQAVTEVK